MAFKGDLNNVSLFDVFQTLSQNKQTGVLVLQRDGCVKKIYIAPEGVRVFFSRSFRPLRLGEIFVRRGMITPQDVEILLLEQKKEYRPIGQLLVESGKVEKAELDRVLRYHAEDELFEAFSWDSGAFAFYDGQEASETPSPLSDILMDPAGLCLEAARRLDEMERLRETIRSNDEYFVHQEGMAADREANSATLLALYDQCRQPQCVDDLRDLVGLSLFDTLGALAQLVHGGLLRPLEVEEMVEVSDQARDTGDHARAARLLELAHGCAPEDRGILEKCIEAVQRLQEPKRLARHLCALGTLCLEADEVDEATEHLEQALRHDSTLFAALETLRDAFARQGDRERVAEASLKIARVLNESGNLDGAIEACAVGLQDAPRAVSLRYYFAQLLLRADRLEDARREIIELVRATESSRKAMRSEKAIELLNSCYRLLLKIDPEDADAALGLKNLEKIQASTGRKRRILVHGGIAVAFLAVLGAVGITVFRGPDAEEIMQEIAAAHQAGQSDKALQLIRELREKHPGSPEAASAAKIAKSIAEAREKKVQERKQVQDRLRREIDERLGEVRAALQDKPYLEALDLLPPLLDQLRQPQLAFLRKSVTSHLEYDLVSFLERVLRRCEDDRQQLAVSQHQLEQMRGGDAGELLELERSLAHIRSRRWPQLVPDLCERLREIAGSRYIGKASKGIEEFIAKIEGAGAAFNNLDALFFAVRAARLKAEIKALRDLADRQGKEYMRTCELRKARELYARAFDKAYSIDKQEPRKYFLDLLTWLERSNIRSELERRRDDLDEVITKLAEVEKLRRENRPHVAYRILRDLFTRHRLIRFEAKYKMPYRVLSTPKGATVFLNDREVGTTPCAIEMDFVPQARIRVERPGFHVAERALLPTDPDNTGTLDFELEKKLAWDREISGTIEASPVIADGKLLLATNRSTLLALELAGGGSAWEAPTDTLDRITAAPVVDGARVYLATAPGRVYRIRLRDGKIDAEPLRLEGKIAYTPVLHDGTLWVATSKPALFAVRGGRVVSRTPLAAAPSGAPVAVDGEIFVPTADRGQILVHDARSGKETRRLRAASETSFFGGLALFGSLVLAGGEDGRLWAFDRGTGETAWSKRTSGPVNAPAAAHGKRILLPSREGYVYGLTPGGDDAVKFDVGYAVERTPVVDNGFLYVAGGRRVVAFDAAAERPWWSHDFDGEEARFVVAGDDYVVVVTDKPWIHAFEKDVR